MFLSQYHRIFFVKVVWNIALKLIICISVDCFSVYSHTLVFCGARLEPVMLVASNSCKLFILTFKIYTYL